MITTMMIRATLMIRAALSNDLGTFTRNTPTYAIETGISANLMGHWAHMQALLPLRSCLILPLPLFRTNARTKPFT